MKFSSALFLLGLLLTLSACNKDDDDEVTSNDIVGTWRLTSLQNETVSEFGASGLKTTTLILAEDTDVTLTFEADGSYAQVGTTPVRTISLVGQDTVLQQTSDFDLNTSGTYTAKDGKLAGFAVESNMQQATPQENSDIDYSITGDRLVFTGKQVVDLSSTGQPGTSELNVREEFVRQ